MLQTLQLWNTQKDGFCLVIETNSYFSLIRSYFRAFGSHFCTPPPPPPCTSILQLSSPHSIVIQCFGCNYIIVQLFTHSTTPHPCIPNVYIILQLTYKPDVVACICNPAKRRLNGRTVRVRIPSGERLRSRWVPIFKWACNPI